MSRFYELLSQAAAAGQPFALAIITEVRGSSPQKKGAKAIFYMDGRLQGTLGGGCLEAEIQDRARRALLNRTPATFDLLLDHDYGWDDGLVCGGQVLGVILPAAAEVSELWRKLVCPQQPVTWGVRPDFTMGIVQDPAAGWLYQETVKPPCALWIAGAGHVAQAVAPLALQLEFDVTVFDDRASLANHNCFPPATNFRVGYWDKILAEPFPPQPAFGLIVTRGHQHDGQVLRQWIGHPFVYLGMIGSRRKARIMFDQFIAGQLATAEQLARVACPVGIDILAASVPEIAISIAAQLVQQRAERVYGETSRGHGAPAIACGSLAAAAPVRPPPPARG